MADKGIRRYLYLILDRNSAKKSGEEMARTLEEAGTKGGKDFFREIKRAYEKTKAELRAKFAAGDIGLDDFKRELKELDLAFNKTLIASMRKARAEGELTDSAFAKMSRSLKTVTDDGERGFGLMHGALGKLAIAAGSFFAVERLTTWGAQAVRNAIDADAVWNRLAATLDNSGVAFSGVEQEVRKAARAMQTATTVGDEEFAEILNNLVTISGDYTGSLKNVQLVADLAARKQIDLRTAAELVGKVMAGETGTLKRYGIVVQEGADAIEVMRERFRGAAENEAQEIAGKLKQVGNEAGDASEAVGGFLLRLVGGGKYLDHFKLGLQGIAEWFDGLARSAGDAILMMEGTRDDKLVAAAKELTELSRLRAEYEAKGWKGTVARLDERIASIRAAMVNLQKERAAAYELGTRPPTPKPETPEQTRAREQAAKKAADEAEKERAREEYWTYGRHKPGVQTTMDGSRERPVRRENGVLVGGGIAPIGMDPQAIEDSTGAAESFTNSWVGALTEVENAFAKAGGSLSEMSAALAEGGIKGLARYAAGKVKENIAAAIEAGAKALGKLAMGNGPAAAFHAKEAAGHAAAAAAWKVAAGGLGGGGTSASGAAAIGGVGNVGARGVEQATQPENHLHLHIDPFDPRRPAVQDFVWQANQNAITRRGDN